MNGFLAEQSHCKAYNWKAQMIDYEEAFKGISYLDIGIVTQMISFVCSLDLCAVEHLTSRLQQSQSRNIQELSMKTV